jgi:hypothetical protein
LIVGAKANVHRRQQIGGATAGNIVFTLALFNCSAGHRVQLARRMIHATAIVSQLLLQRQDLNA